ncbi:MAG: hypothetical protein ACTS46_01765 [Candidatus Hodgkinia cicadicola]
MRPPEVRGNGLAVKWLLNRLVEGGRTSVGTCWIGEEVSRRLTAQRRERLHAKVNRLPARCLSLDDGFGRESKGT